MADHRKPDFILWAVVEGKNASDKPQWVRFGAAWRASKGYSLKVEDSFRLFPPFNNPRVGLALMPFEERNSNNTNGDDEQGNRNRRGRR